MTRQRSSGIFGPVYLCRPLKDMVTRYACAWKAKVFVLHLNILLYHNMWSTCCTICNTHKVLVIKPVRSSKHSLWLQLVQHKICKLCNNDTYSIFYKAFAVLSRQVCCENACFTPWTLTCKILISVAALMYVSLDLQVLCGEWISEKSVATGGADCKLMLFNMQSLRS